MAKKHEEEEALITHLVLAGTKISLEKGPNFFSFYLSACLKEEVEKKLGLFPFLLPPPPPPPPLRPPPPFPPTKRRRKKNIPTGEEEENKMCVRSSLVLPWVGGGGRRENIRTHTKKVPPSSTHIVSFRKEKNSPHGVLKRSVFFKKMTCVKTFEN